MSIIANAYSNANEDPKDKGELKFHHITVYITREKKFMLILTLTAGFHANKSNPTVHFHTAWWSFHKTELQCSTNDKKNIWLSY